MYFLQYFFIISNQSNNVQFVKHVHIGNYCFNYFYKCREYHLVYSSYILIVLKQSGWYNSTRNYLTTRVIFSLSS